MGIEIINGDCLEVKRSVSSVSKLKPCPFCGGKAEIISDIWGYEVLCDICKGGVSKYNYTESQAIEAWNKRVEQTDTK